MQATGKAKLIKNAHLFDPSSGIDGIGDILISGRKIAGINPAAAPKDAEIIDADGNYLFPAFADVHVHFRTPGQEHKENLKSGSRAALAGGFTTVIQMPNTLPVIDTPELVRRISGNSPIELRTLAILSTGRKIGKLSDLTALFKAGAVGFTDDGLPVMDADIMRSALEFSAESGTVIANHCEDFSIGGFGAIRDSDISEELGVSGWNPERESVMAERDCRLSMETGGKLHICHVSYSGTIDVIRSAKSKGAKVTAEVTPHHLVLTTEAVRQFGTDAKMNPPLGDDVDRDALISALEDGVIDCIATDHAPHTPEEKSGGLGKAAFGVIGLETSFPACYTHLVKSGRISLSRVIDALSARPRDIYSLERVGLFDGSRADLVLISMDEEFIVDPDKFESKSRNCPFRGMKVFGRILWTMYAGKIKWKYHGYIDRK